MLGMEGDAGRKAVDRECAREVGLVSHFECTHGRNGQGARNDLIDSGSRPRSSALEDKIEPIIREHPERSNNQVLAEAGLTRNHHAVAARVRDRLEEEGAIPSAPVREGSDGSMRHVVTHAKPGPAAPPTAEPTDGGALGQMVDLFRKLAGPIKRQLVTRLLRELSDEDRAEVFSEIGK